MGLSRRQIKTVAKIHSAIHLSYIDGFMFGDDPDISIEEQHEIIDEIKSIATNLANGLPMNLGNTDQIIEYVKKNHK